MMPRLPAFLPESTETRWLLRFRLPLGGDLERLSGGVPGLVDLGLSA